MRTSGIALFVCSMLAASSATASSPLQSARNALAERVPASRAHELAHVATVTLPDGRRMLRFAERHAGLPVLTRGASVLVDANARATSFVTTALAEGFPDVSTPKVDAATAAARATRMFRVATFDAADARLAWLPEPKSSRLVWVLYRGWISGTTWAPVVLVDAASGRTVMAWNALGFDRQASVFAQNPVRTPAAALVTLDTLDPGATTLSDSRFHSFTCVDEHTLEGSEQVHFCQLEPKAVADAQGDFPYAFTSDTDPEDAFAEVSMYYHANEAYSFFQGLGMPALLSTPLTTVANLRLPSGWDTQDMGQLGNPNLPLQPYDNAFFTPEDPYGDLFQGVGAGLYFGQGEQADFAYDGDVVYHELGHAMIDRTVRLVSSWHLDSQGAYDAPGAMNEGLADYFSSALTGDGQVGEYAAKNIGYGDGAPFIRNLDNSLTCPRNLTGEPHADSLLFSGGLWKVRQQLEESDRASYDTALMTALVGAPSGDVGYDDLAQLFLTALEASPLGATASASLKKEFESRGVLPSCTRVLEYTSHALSSDDSTFGNAYFAPGRPYVGFDSAHGYAPGLFQVHVKLLPGTVKLRVHWSEVALPAQYQFQGPDVVPYTPAVLARFGAGAITFDYADDVSSNADGPLEPKSSAVELDVPPGATEAWVMLVNQGDDPGLYRQLELVQKKPAPSTGGTGGSGGDAGVPDAGGAPSVEPELHASGGCSTRGPGGAGAPALFGVLLALVTARGARRRRAHRAETNRGCSAP